MGQSPAQAPAPVPFPSVVVGVGVDCCIIGGPVTFHVVNKDGEAVVTGDIVVGANIIGVVVDFVVDVDVVMGGATHAFDGLGVVVNNTSFVGGSKFVKLLLAVVVVVVEGEVDKSIVIGLVVVVVVALFVSFLDNKSTELVS